MSGRQPGKASETENSDISNNIFAGKMKNDKSMESNSNCNETTNSVGRVELPNGEKSTSDLWDEKQNLDDGEDVTKCRSEIIDEKQHIKQNGHQVPTVENDENASPRKGICGVCSVFRFADGIDIVLMVLGSLAAMVTGSALPVSFLCIGDIMSLLLEKKNVFSLANSTEIAKQDTEGLYDQAFPYIAYLCGVATCVMVLGWVMMFLWTWSAQRQTQKIRQRFFNSVLRQHIGWFDAQSSGQITTYLSDAVLTIQNGIGEKIAVSLHWSVTFLVGIIFAFSYGWKLTLVAIAFVPLMIVTGAVMMKCAKRFTEKELTSYAKAGAVAHDVIRAIRTVHAFGGQKKETERYACNLRDAHSVGIQKSIIAGAMHACLQLGSSASIAVIFWYGIQLVIYEDFKSGRIFQVLVWVIFSSMSLGMAAQNFSSFVEAAAASTCIYKIIDSTSEIDSYSESGLRPDGVEGEIEFDNVSFTYQSRSDVAVLTDINFKVKVGQTVALVGASGAGKSTVVQLLQRFFDCTHGQVKFGNFDVRDLNVKWLRQQIGVVSQEPVLFSDSIAQNIRYGRDDITDDEIEMAAKEANAHDFIISLPQKYETYVGENGTQLSGGQKQRIAIARALARNPKLLVLDEATSALDLENEAIVQSALDKACAGRTTVVVAHRLSTVRNADLIIAMKDGSIVEQGTHEELYRKRGEYYQLVNAQIKDKEDMGPESKESSSRLKKGTNGNIDLSDRTRLFVHESETVEEEVPRMPLKRIAKLNLPELPFICGGIIASAVVGAAFPSFIIILSEILGSTAWTNFEETEKKMSMFAGVIVAMGIIAGVGYIFQYLLLGVAGERLTMRLRKMAFSAIMKQDVAWFDDPTNQVGTLTARLATDASNVKGAAGPQLGLLSQSVTTVVAALIIGFVFSWKLTLVALLFSPLLIVAGHLRGRINQGNYKAMKLAVDQGGAIATEAITNIRTLASLTRERTFEDKYNQHFTKFNRDARWQACLSGIVFSVADASKFFSFAAVFAYGCYLIEQTEMTFPDLFKVFGVIVLGSLHLGRASSYFPDYNKAKISAVKLFALFDRVPAIDVTSNAGEIPSHFHGEVEAEDISFNYPSRPHADVLKGLSFHISPGQVVAIVGSSGCGKSTIVQLIQRLYEVQSGCLKIDSRNIKDLNIQWLRSQIGLVSQEPVLFDMTIKDNIAYGDNTRDVTMDEIVAAARQANIHNFIESIPLGYETQVGEKGTQLSGGQKQRVAIARALIRNPKIILLDEATSSLDAGSEKPVQEALERAQAGRTTIVIAHRLSTIQNADKIVVINNGTVAEEGTHSELMTQKNHYYMIQQS